MMEVVSNIVGISIISFSHIYAWHCLEKKKIDFKDYKFYIVLALYVFLLMLSVSIVDKFVKIACTTIISMLLNYFLMRKNIKRTVLMPAITQIVSMIAETTLALILILCDVNLDLIASNLFGGFAINASVAVIVILIFLLCTFLPSLYQKILKATDRIDSEYLIILVFVVILIANVSAMNVYYKIDFKYLLIFNTLVTVVYFIIIVSSLYNRNNYLKVFDKYSTTLSNLKEYEDILDQYRVSNKIMNN